MKLIVRRIILSLLPPLYMVIIWIQSGYFNPESISNFSSNINNIVILLIGVCFELTHLFEFGLLYFLIILAFLSWGELTKRKVFIAIIISFLYGVVDEIHQFFVPFRSSSLVDLLKNTIGIIAFAWITNWPLFRNGKFKTWSQLK
jgi:polysaccharide biosynthesis protein VpsQ